MNRELVTRLSKVSNAIILTISSLALVALLAIVQQQEEADNAQLIAAMESVK